MRKLVAVPQVETASVLVESGASRVEILAESGTMQGLPVGVMVT